MRLRIPHQVVDSGLQGEIESLVTEAQLLVVQNIADVGKIQGIECDHRVEVNGIVCLLSRDVSGQAG